MRILFVRKQTLIKVCLIVALCILISGWTVHYYQSEKDRPTLKRYEPIYQGNSDKKQVSIICNVVWGEEFLPVMLQELRKEDAKITFFIGGQWAGNFPELVEMIDKEGHEIGNHGYNHLHPTQISVEKNADEIQRTEKIIFDLINKKTKLFHPPYREINEQVTQQAGQLGYKVIMSSVDTIDWQRPDPQVIINRVLSKAHNGAIILMHPTAPTVKALPVMIKGLKDKGYKIVPVSELLL